LIRIRNKYDFTNLSEFIFDWEVASDGSVIQSGKISIPDLKPKAEVLVKIPLQKIESSAGAEYFLNMRVSRSDEWTIVPEDHIYATAQFKMPVEGEPVKIKPDELAVLQTSIIIDKYEIAGTDMKVVFNLKTGRLESYIYKGTSLVLKGPEPDFWRAPTDNDYGYNMDRMLGVWKKAGENNVVTKADITQPGLGRSEIVFRYDIKGPDGEKIANYSTKYIVLASGDILVSNTFEKISDMIPELPRMGMQMQLPVEFVNLRWYGRGPHENYSDRKTSAEVGLYESTVADQYVPYIRPQENGYKTDTRWLTITNDNGTGILVSGNPLICFAAMNYIHDDFESPGKLSRYRPDAKTANTHTNDVKPRELVNLNIDLAQMGVGGDNSWGAPIHMQYRLSDRKYEYSFRIRPVLREDDILKLAKQRF